MSCEQARETLLGSFTGPILPGVNLAMEDHIATCEACRQFARLHQTLEGRLTEAVAHPSLSPGFRSSLREKLDRPRIPFWPDSLPDIAHLVGCTLGIVLLLLVVPQYS